MASQQGAPSRPWFRLATMVRPPPPPPPPAPSNQGPPPPRPPAFIRPTFTATAPQSTLVGPPPQPSPAQPPQQTSTPTPPPQQRDITPSPPRSTPTPQPSPPPPIRTNEVEPTTRDPPSKPPSPPPSTPPSPPKSQSTREITPPSSPTKTITKSPPPSPRATTNNVVTPPASPPSPRVQRAPLVSPPPPSPPKRFRFYTSPPSSPRRPPPMQLPEHPLPPSSPPRSTIETSATTKPLSPLVLPSSLKQKSYNDTPPEYMQKTMHVQEIKEKPMTTTTTSATGLLNARGTHTHNSTRSRPETTHKKHLDSEDAGGKNIITIAGENKGALMILTPFEEKKRESSHNIHISSRHNPATSSNNDDEKLLETDTKAKDKLLNHNNNNNQPNSLLKTAFLNSNVQGINNSILFSSSVNHHDPGIHLTLSAATKPGGGTTHDSTRSNNGQHGNII
uniref:vegetative cell wall protein gp1 n=1 Tax=Erigeron canadensis TaxID=72917 RepID=UPI001CB9D631|nr:vegetative cell wall protein gp1 [Erigeron canadensis]